MSISHAVALAERVHADKQPYVRMLVDHHEGRRKSCAPPKQYGISKEDAADLRGMFAQELLRGEPVLVPRPPLPKVMSRGRAPKRFSLSMMQAAQDCLLSARLNREHDTSGAPAILGRIVHELCDVLAMRAEEEGRARYTPQEAREAGMELLAQPDDALPLSLAAWEEALRMMERWAAVMEFWPDADLLLPEQLVTVELGGITFSGRIDLTQVKGDHARIDDYKTGWAVPTRAEFDAKLQLPFYCTALRPLLPQVKSWDVGEVYLRHDWLRNRRIDATLLTEELDLDAYLIASGRRLKTAYESRVFPATPGAHCANCSLPERCPIPRALRPDAAFEEEEHVQAGLDWLVSVEAQTRKVKKAMRGWMERHDVHEVTSGHGMSATLSVGEKRSLDEPALLEALRDDVDAEDLYRYSATSSFQITRTKSEAA